MNDRGQAICKIIKYERVLCNNILQQSKFLPPVKPVVVVNNNVEQEKLIKTMEKKTNKQEKEIRNLRKDIEGFKGQVIEFEARVQVFPQCIF